MRGLRVVCHVLRKEREATESVASRSEGHTPERLKAEPKVLKGKTLRRRDLIRPKVRKRKP